MKVQRGGGGPRLPFKLAKEVGGDKAGPSGGGRGPTSRRDRRRADRQSKKGAGHQPKSQYPQKPLHGAIAEEREQRPGKRQRSEQPGGNDQGRPRPPARVANKFNELLAPSASKSSGAAGVDAEVTLQRDLAKRLGLKKGKASLGDDELDGLLHELGGLDDVLDSDSDGGGPRAKSAALKQRRIRAEASDSEGGDSEGEQGDSSGAGDSEVESDSGDSLDQPHSRSELGNSSGSGAEEEDRDGGSLDEPDDSGSGGDGDELSGRDSGCSLERAGAQESGGEGGASEEEEVDLGTGSGERATPVPATALPAGKYVPPGVRRAAAAAAGGGRALADDCERVMRRVRGLLNRLAEANLQGIVADLGELYRSEGRRLVSDALTLELESAAAEGPRASEAFAAVAAAAVAALAALSSSSELIANFLARVALSLERAMHGGDSLAAANLVMVVAHLYLVGALKPDLVYGLLGRWRLRFGDADVAAMAALLGAAGLALRAADPERMKEFVVEVHERAAAAGTLSSRTRVMLELVVDVKNNRKRDGAKRKSAALGPAATKWLKGCGVGAVALGGISWEKVLARDKRGVWWEPTAADTIAAARGGAPSGGGAAAALGAEAGVVGPELLALAARMRMNTDSRRAVFCVVMGSEDCVDAFEKLLRLGLKGDQEREVVRVTVECCLQEAAWNKYYALLLVRLCGAAKGHRRTLQYCLWDHVKEVPQGMEVRRMTHLARLAAAVVAGGALPGSVLKVSDFGDGLAPREVLFWRLFFEHLFASSKSAEEVGAVFEGIAAQQQLAGLKTALRRFLKRRVGPWLAEKEPGRGGSGSAERLAMLLQRCRLAERALAGAR